MNLSIPFAIKVLVINCAEYQLARLRAEQAIGTNNFHKYNDIAISIYTRKCKELSSL